jgi:hypothetical protein
MRPDGGAGCSARLKTVKEKFQSAQLFRATGVVAVKTGVDVLVSPKWDAPGVVTGLTALSPGRCGNP